MPLFANCTNSKPPRHDEAHETLSPARLERLFIYAAAWGLGGLLDVRDRAGFDAELRSFGSNMPPRCVLTWALLACSWSWGLVVAPSRWSS